MILFCNLWESRSPEPSYLLQQPTYLSLSMVALSEDEVTTAE